MIIQIDIFKIKTKNKLINSLKFKVNLKVQSKTIKVVYKK